MTPLTLMTLNANLAKLMIDTQAVMTLRLLGMAGALPQTRGENARMPRYGQSLSGGHQSRLCRGHARPDFLGRDGAGQQKGPRQPQATDQISLRRKRHMRVAQGCAP